jgi:hypothetical protein
MNRTRELARYRKWINLELVGKLPRRLRLRLHEHLRSNAESRAYYDRGIEAFRSLEGGRDLSHFELSMVETWLADGLAEAEALPASGRLRRWIAPGLGILGVATALLLTWGLLPPPQGDGLEPRGDAQGRGLAIEVMCASRLAGGVTPMRPAELGSCDVSGLLGFAYRASPHEDVADGRWLSLFGVDERGKVLYYAPTPADDAAIAARADHWTAAPISVDAKVNHRSGTVRVFGLLSPEIPDVAKIDAWGAILRDLPAASEGDEPWHERLEPAAMTTVCRRLDLCDSAELSFELREEKP